MSRLAFIDTETTGLNPQDNEIIEIAIKIIDESLKEDNELYSVEAKFKPRRLDLASPRALEINGYNEEEWKGAYRWNKVACERLVNRLKGCILVGHNVQFDINFIREECKRQGVRCPRFSTLDTKGMARFLWGEDELRSVSMDSIREHSEHFDKEGSHRAMKDIEDCMMIWKLFKKQISN